ncbi:acetyl-CoA hydrolase/transferase C-terminal domain-containing protein [Neobacillus niacini]|uniref:acetyl-CoA hydrolase/transferase family protein n=1 Tax=Neobacillus niacini TaxID=86668 RepID=UPI0007AB2A4E|nr:acetyl-CoA hydrolase/transferase C-terminal domain-containing protein [Neobacillus niacini]MEC1525014.1 acetyl-CoA hydrolase/transferase C-terminal domain-containing protein [Neobacillus niacini]
MSFYNEFQLKKININQFLNLIESNMLLFFEQGAAEPTAIIQGLLDHFDKVPRHRILVNPVPNLNKSLFSYDIGCEQWEIYTLFGTPEIHKKISEGKIQYIPVNTSEIPTILGTTFSPDITIIQVSPPDNNGFCNLGITAETLLTAIEEAKIVVAQVNQNMPVTYGQTGIHISDIDYFIDGDSPLLEYYSPVPSEIEEKIADEVSHLIPDRATLQIGIGRIPDAILGKLANKKDLGIHSGLISDKMIELFKLGVITGRYKKVDKQKIIGTNILGSRELYDFCHKNPSIELRPVTYTHNISLAAQLDSFISINSAIEIDLSGQVNSESIDGRQISGVGGQLDFIRMARKSRGGKAIIALPSTDRRGNSKIIPVLSSSVPVSTPRTEIDVVVTEFGAVSLRYQPLIERARRLISIAHPNHRPHLEEWLRTL